jgi:hypothetical protein
MKNSSRELASVKTRAAIQPGKLAPKCTEKRIDLQKSPSVLTRKSEQENE